MITFVIQGIPQQTGSKKAFAIPGSRRAIITDQNKNAKPWMACVRAAAEEAMGGFSPMQGPVELSVKFVFPRPKNHFGTGKRAGTLKPTAPVFVASMPDTSKLMRCIEDAMSKVIYGDDRQIVRYRDCVKRYVVDGEYPHAEVCVAEVEEAAKEPRLF